MFSGVKRITEPFEKKLLYRAVGPLHKQMIWTSSKCIFVIYLCSSTQVVSEAVGGEEDTTDNSLQDIDSAAADAPRWTSISKNCHCYSFIIQPTLGIKVLRGSYWDWKLE